MQKVEIYATRFCPYCVRAKGLLQQKGVDYVEYDLGENPDLRAVMVERSNGGRTVPQIFIGDTHVGGSDDLFALERSNKLDTLLNG